MNISDQVREESVGNVRLLLLKTSVDNVASFSGSVFTGPDMIRNEDVLQDIAVSLLDKGTNKRDKFEIASELESKGADIRYSSRSARIGFSGHCLSRDVASTLATLSEQLREPAFEQDEYDKLMPRLQASVLQSMESTSSQAGTGLRRLLFRPEHPNYSHLPEHELALLNETDVADVSAFYRRSIGANSAVLAIVGDFEYDEVIAAVTQSLADWKESRAQVAYEAKPYASVDSSSSYPMNDRQNVDVRIGHSIDISRLDDDYLPLYIGAYVLGGNFSSRLMDTIRDREGLTYGIGSSLVGFDTLYSGYFLIRATFSQENLDTGIRRTKELLEEFGQRGVTAEEVTSKKRTIVGGYQVALATTAALASTLSSNAERGFETGYIDRFPNLIDEISVESVNESIARRFKYDQLKLATAGIPTGEK